jgi:tetratricopeptide (TPR) repeat protein
MSDQTLRRLVKWTGVAVVLLLVAFSAIYYLGQRTSSGPTLTERAVASAEKTVSDSPNDLTARLKLAAAYRENKQFEDATAQYNEILKAKPTARPALVGLGETLLAKGDLDGATTALTKVTGAKMTWAYETQDPQLQKAFYDLGSIASQQGKLTQAEDYLANALRIDATDADALYLLGTVQLKNNDPGAAIATLSQAIEFVPTGWAEPYTALAAAYTKLGKKDEAAYANAMVDFANGKNESAKATLSTLTSSAIKVKAMLGLGMITEKDGDRTAAKAWYQKVLAANPTDFSAQAGLGRVTDTAATTTGTK